jgi:hypothetical protein
VVVNQALSTYQSISSGEDSVSNPSAAENSAPPAAATGRTEIRHLDPSLARYYFSYGALSGEKPPGGTGGARVISSEEGVIARDGGSAVNFSKISNISKYVRAAARRPSTFGRFDPQSISRGLTSYRNSLIRSSSVFSQMRGFWLYATV